jgi:hypothetical protein
MPYPMVYIKKAGILSARCLKSKCALLWKKRDRLVEELRTHPSKRIEKAMAKINAELRALGEI